MVVRDPGPLVGPGSRTRLLRPRSGRFAPVLPSIAEFAAFARVGAPGRDATPTTP